jgi:hypothetical protein
MMIIITICLVLITLVLLLGREDAWTLLGGIFWLGVMLGGVIGLIFMGYLLFEAISNYYTRQ